MAFGRKNVIDLNPFNYNIGLIGEGGIGKTTVIKEMCEKLLGNDGWNDDGIFVGGYLFVECGKEDGADAINGINYINTPDWDSDYDELTNSVGFNTLITDILENKTTDYPNLKEIVIDTYDQLRQIVEPEIIRRHNKQHPDKRTTSIKAAFGGFMAGEDMCDDLILEKLWELKNVGVHFTIIGHVKQRDITDPINGDSYSQLTTDMSMRSFNKIKTKLHFLGVAAVDREIAKEKKNGKDKNVVKNESRVITFRDDNYSIDSKSRFADIVDRIPLDADALIKALKDAIEIEAKKGSTSITELKKNQMEREEKLAKKADAASIAIKTEKENANARDEYLAAITKNFPNAEANVKKEVKSLLKDNGYTKVNDESVPIALLKAIADML